MTRPPETRDPREHLSPIALRLVIDAERPEGSLLPTPALRLATLQAELDPETKVLDIPRERILALLENTQND